MEVYENRSTRISTSKFNELMLPIIEATPPPALKGKYVKIKHNGAYSTQYLHMSKRLVRVGQRVSQGDVIGKIGMTGNT